ncbi:MAG: hypothetical protein IPN99_05630 [Bacteroidetes bacterium]|nr:hypothetical protein [Bacteroidota bacterium]
MLLKDCKAAIFLFWIDYNQNQLFEASEWNQVTVGSSVGVASSVSITIPGSAASGLTRMANPH